MDGIQASPSAHGRCGTRLEEVFNPRLAISSPTALPVAGIIEDCVSELDKKVSAEASSLKSRKLSLHLPPDGKCCRYYAWEDDDLPTVVSQFMAVAALLDN